MAAKGKIEHSSSSIYTGKPNHREKKQEPSSMAVLWCREGSILGAFMRRRKSACSFGGGDDYCWLHLTTFSFLIY